jgi:hypothetical protein
MIPANEGGATFIAMRAKVAITRGQVVIIDSVDQEVDLPAGAGAANTFGFARNDAAIGELVSIHVSGGLATAIAGGSITAGQLLQTGATPGQVVPVGATAGTNYPLVGKACGAASTGDLFRVVPLHGSFQG